MCHLKNILYGLKQVPCAWFQKLKTFLAIFGFISIQSYSSLFVQFNSTSTSIHFYQEKYIKDLLSRAGMTIPNPYPHPCHLVLISVDMMGFILLIVAFIEILLELSNTKPLLTLRFHFLSISCGNLWHNQLMFTGYL